MPTGELVGDSCSGSCHLSQRSRDGPGITSRVRVLKRRQQSKERSLNQCLECQASVMRTQLPFDHCVSVRCSFASSRVRVQAQQVGQIPSQGQRPWSIWPARDQGLKGRPFDDSPAAVANGRAVGPQSIGWPGDPGRWPGLGKRVASWAGRGRRCTALPLRCALGWHGGALSGRRTLG